MHGKAQLVTFPFGESLAEPSCTAWKKGTGLTQMSEQKCMLSTSGVWLLKQLKLHPIWLNLSIYIIEQYAIYAWYVGHYTFDSLGKY